MNDSSKYFTYNNKNPTPERTASSYLDIKYDAAFEAWYESDFKNTGFTTPFLKYQGPGNSSNLGEPNSEGDYYAKVHDLRYAYASYLYANKQITYEQFHSKIDYADETFVEANSKFTPVGLIGRIGISTKQFLEKASSWWGDKHIYPGSNPQIEDYQDPDLNKEEFDVVNLLENKMSKFPIHKDKVTSEYIYGITKNNVPQTAQQFNHGLKIRAGNFAKAQLKKGSSMTKEKLTEHYLKDQLYTLREAYGDNFDTYFPPSSFSVFQGLSDTHGVPYYTTKETERTKLLAVQSTSKRPSDSVEDEPPNKQVALNEPIEENNETITNTDTVTNTDEEMRGQGMQVDDQAKSDSANVSGGTGISTAVDQIYISQGFSQMGNKTTFKNSFRIRSFGTSLFLTAGATTATSIAPSTCVYPHVALPVEYMWFYLPKGAFAAMQSLPQCKPKRIGVKVTPIGQMVSFATNTDASQIGTTSHTLYGSAVIGLNNKVPCDKVTITRSTTAPMVIASASTFNDSTAWIERLWGKELPSQNVPITNATLQTIIDSASNHEVIFPNTYLRVYFPTPNLAVTTQIPTDASLVTSFWNTNRFIPKFPMQPKTGTPIINFEYSYEWPVMSSATAPNIYAPGPANKGITVARRGKRGKQSLTQTGLTTINTQFGVNQADETGNQLLKLAHNADTYENFCFNNFVGYNAMATEQNLLGPSVPSVHFGIEAVRSNVPETSSLSYINASCDYYVETEIEFEFRAEQEFNFSSFTPIFGNYNSNLGGNLSAGNIAATNTIFRNNQPLY